MSGLSQKDFIIKNRIGCFSNRLVTNSDLTQQLSCIAGVVRFHTDGKKVRKNVNYQLVDLQISPLRMLDRSTKC